MIVNMTRARTIKKEAFGASVSYSILVCPECALKAAAEYCVGLIGYYDRRTFTTADS